MQKVGILLAVALAIGISLLGVLKAAAPRAEKTAMSPSGGTLLTGKIRSLGGQAEEGITVSARAERSTVTTTVFTDAEGVYVFPPLEKGKYQIWAQAVGLATGRAEVSLGGSKALQQNFELKPVKDVTRQMAGADWFASLPEDTIQDHRMKNVFQTSCAGCHQPNYVLQNRFDKTGWVKIMDVMKMVNVVGIYNRKSPFSIIQYHEQELADYLAKVCGPGASPMKIKVVSRPQGEATLAVITEYAIELAAAPGEYPAQDGNDWSQGVPSSMNGSRGIHEVEIDFSGNLWVGNSQDNPNRTYAKIDAKTGKVTSYKVLGPNGKVRTSHAIRKDANGILWLIVSGGEARFGAQDGGVASLARLDPNTGKLDLYTAPGGMSGIYNLTVDVDGKGKIWASTKEGVLRFDPLTSKFTEFKSRQFKTSEGMGETYGVAGDSEGNGYWTQMALDIVNKGDMASGKSVEIKIPPRKDKMEIVTPEDRKVYEQTWVEWDAAVPPWDQGPRRLGADRAGNALWVANFWGDNLAKIDIHTNQITQYPTPRYSGIYDTIVDKKHVVWANMMNNDSVAKFDPASGKWTEYMLPTHGAETRHISIDDRQYPPVLVVPYSRSSKVAVLRFRTKEDLQALREQVQKQRLQAQN
jgi:streptogramin lyase